MKSLDKLSTMFAFFGVNRAQLANFTHRAPCLKGFKVVGHEFRVNPCLTSVRPAELNLTVSAC